MIALLLMVEMRQVTSQVSNVRLCTLIPHLEASIHYPLPLKLINVMLYYVH